MDIKHLLQIYSECSGPSTDTRTINEGAMFFALSGDNFNGNSFAAEALKKGAKYVVIDDPKYLMGKDYILVDNVLNALQQLALAYRMQFNIPFIGITGTNGKTTTKELITAVLNQKFRTHATKGNLNNHIGVPLTLLTMPATTEIAIIEMGANHIGEIDALCQIAQPTHGIITNIGKAHLEGFGGVNGVITAKTELYKHLTQHEGTIFYNSDDSLLCKQEMTASKISYGHELADFVYSNRIDVAPFAAIELNKTLIKSSLIGSYNASNMAAAACIGAHFGVHISQIRNAIESYQPKNQRSQLLDTGNNHLILDAYNANPSSVELALKDFSNNPGNPKLAVLGDMFELGDDSHLEHQKIVDLCEQLGVPCFLVGEAYGKTKQHKTNIHFRNTSDCITHLNKYPIKNHHILIKGSRGMALERICDSL